MTLAAGTRLGPYEILDQVGSGGMGEVYRARDPRLGRDVAVKVISTDGPPSTERLRRFEDEARAVASLSHPNVLTVFDVGARDGMPYVVFELLEGETLRERLRRGPLPLRAAVETAVQACRGLQAAHGRGILHRDLKPENLFLTSDGFVKILDFGLAKLTRGDGADAAAGPTPTVAGAVVGTPGYLSPEQARWREPDARSDIFALGAILYEALSGKRAFSGATVAETISAILHEDPPPVRTGSGPLPGAVERVVRRCLAKEREDRFHSAHDLALALEAVLERPLGREAEPEEDVRGPYPGLSYFTEADAGRFFGRETEVEALWQRIRSRRLLGVIGPSGAGKTSFVRAGVVASRPSGWAAVVTTPGSAPLLMLGQALAPELQGDVEALRQLVRFDDAEAASALLSRWRQGHAQALLVVDQFEELFTQCPPETQARFAALLGRLAGEAGIHVVLSMRDDFLMRCHEHEALGPVFSELTPLGPLVGEALRRALEEPAKAEGFRFEEGLVGKMTAAVEGERGALPLLAFAVSRLWETRDAERSLLTHAAYAEIGGVAGALARHAEETLERIGAERQGMVREIFRNLVTSQGTRAACEREELLSVFPDRKAAEEVLNHLVAGRLLTSWEMPVAESGAATPGSAPGRHRVEIVHESLLRSWLRLVRWQAQDAEGALLRDQLRQAAHLWEEKGRPADLLWSGTSFREYELWRERYPGRLTALEEDFARAMTDRARRRRRVRRAAVSAVVVALSVVAIVVSWSRHQAAKARDEARAEALRAEAQRLVTLAQLRLADDPTEALAYATASLEVADMPEARVFVMKALWEAPPSLTLPVGPPPQRAPAFSPDGRKLAAGGHSPVAFFWSESGGPPTSLDGNEISPRGPTFAGWSADGHLVTGLCCALATRVHVWSAEGKRLRTIEFGALTEWQVGREHILGRTEEGPPGSRTLLLRSWPLGSGEARVLGRVPTSVLGRSALSIFLPDGAGLVYARGREVFLRSFLPGTSGGERLVGRHDADVDQLWADQTTWDRVLSHDRSGETRVWTLVGGKLELQRVIPRPATAPAAAVGGGQRWVCGYSWDERNVRLWDLEALPGSRPLELRRSGSWYLAGTVLHPRGDWLTVFQSGEGRAAFWPLRQRYPSVVDGYTPISRPVAFSPDGRWLATSWADGTLRLWSMPGTGPREPRTLELPETTLWETLAFDPRGRYLFAVGNCDRAWIVPLDGSRPRRLPIYSEDTLLQAGAVSPGGRQVATAFGYGRGPKTLRLHDVETGKTRVLPLPTEAESLRDTDSSVEGAVFGMGFFDEATLYTSGWAGLRRWDLAKGTSELVAADVDFFGFLGPDRRRAFTGAPVPGREDRACRQMQVRDLLSGESSAATPVGVCVGALFGAASGEIVATPGPDGVLVTRLPAETSHLLAGHEGSVVGVAISPDGRWVATSGEDNTLRLWPMPDLSKPPLHTLPHDDLVAKLQSLTNVRVVRDPSSSSGWRIDLAPFPGWKDVPTW